MNDPERDRLNELGARIRQAEEAQKPVPSSPLASAEGMKASRIGFDFVSTIGGCTLVGWLIDREMGWSPWALLTLLLAGFVAGMMNVWRAMNAPGNKKV